MITNKEHIVGQVPFFLKNWSPSRNRCWAAPIYRATFNLSGGGSSYIVNAFSAYDEYNKVWWILAGGNNGRIFGAKTSTWATQYWAYVAGVPLYGAAHNFWWFYTRSGAGGARLAFPSLSFHTALPVATPTAPTPSEGGAGNLNGTYYWRVTFVVGATTSLGILESAPSPASSALTVTNKQVVLTIPTNTAQGEQTIQRRIWRYGGTVNEWKLVGVVNDNTTTTFTDNVPDAAIVGNESLDITTLPMNMNGYAIASYQNRLWISSGNRLYFSEVGNAVVYHPTTDAEWKGGWIDLQIGEGSIQALAPLPQGLVVFTNKDVWILMGTTPDQYSFVLLAPNLGVSNPKQVAYSGTNIVWWRKDAVGNLKVYLFDGQQIKDISSNISNCLSFLASLNATETPSSIAIAGQSGLVVLLFKRLDLTGEPTDSEQGLGYPVTIDMYRPIQFLIYDPATESWSFAGVLNANVVDIVGFEDRFAFVTYSGKIYEWQPLANSPLPNGVIWQSGKWRTPDGFRWVITGFNVTGKIDGTAELLVITEETSKVFTFEAGAGKYYPVFANMIAGREFEFILKCRSTSGIDPNIVLHVNMVRGGI
ncbi:MAG: hypothetical protein QXT10_04540 [Candidatus Bathyarchaeia archaeon]